jgi:predicted Ser/Thr protein kinase
VRTIGRYEVEGEIGRGAMGVVHLAHDPRVRRRVAVKTFTLPHGLSEEQAREYRERFLREAQAAGRLSHPGIVTIYDVDEDGDEPFIAMEYVDGHSLLELLPDEGGIDAQRAISIVADLAAALQVAHEAGVVHRDVKPANVLVRGDDGAVKIADFGVARMTSSELTRAGTSLGSPAYMSPEQVRGGEVDGRSDLFALAVILYELLTGRRPFEGRETAELVYAIAHETPVPPSRIAPGLPAGLDRFFERALAKSPEDRFPDAAAFRAALLEARDDRAAAPGTSTVVAQPLGVPLPPPLAAPAAPAAASDHGQRSGPFDETAAGRGGRRRLVAVVAAVGFLLLLGWWVLGGGEAYLKLDAKSSVEAGELIVEVDGEQVYARRLAAPQSKKGLLKKMLEQNQETFEAWIEMDPGKHEVIARVVPDGDERGYRDTVVVDLEPGETRRLKLVAGRSFGTPLSLKVH